MAIAGLHSVSVLDSSFLRDSQSHASRRMGDGRRGSTRSSSLLQMWRDIEDEHAVSQVQGRPGEVLLEQRNNGSVVDHLSLEDTPDTPEIVERHDLEDAVLGETESETWSQSQSQTESHDGHEDSNNSSCENSSVFGEGERERVRRIFREWMNNGSRDRGSNISRRSNSPRGEWLGETEQERVRVIREWVQMSSQQRSVSSAENTEQPCAEIDTQIERVRDGLVVNHSEGQNEHTRRGMRKLRGKQVMLDMLKKAERERQREIQELLDHQAVSRFPHRNRIQALLRGRFLRNDRSVDHNKSTSVAESELGLLRQKQTVSGLREGFFSRMDNTSCSQATSNLSDTSSNTDIDFNTNERTGESSSCMVIEPNNRNGNRVGISGGHCLEGTTCKSLDCQESTSYAEGNRLQFLQIESVDSQSSSSVGYERRDDTGKNVDVMAIRDTASELIQHSLQIGDSDHSNNQEKAVHVWSLNLITEGTTSWDIDFNTNEQTGESSSCMVIEPNNRNGNRVGISGGHCLEGTTCKSLDCQESTSYAEGNRLQFLQIESVDSQSSSSVGYERRDDTGKNVDVMAIRDTASELIQHSLQIGDSDHSNNQESSKVPNEQSELGDISNGENDSPNHNDYAESNVVDDVNYGPDALEELPEEIVENEGSGWHQSNTELINSADENADDNQLSNTANEWPENSWANEDGENPRLQEASEVWQEDSGFQEAVENWLGGPSDHETAPAGRVRSLYFPDDDNVYNVELRELHSRRRVSNLLGSSFRENLDQLIQSYVERQGHANMEWDMEEATPFAASVEQNLEQQSRDHIVDQEGTINSRLDLPSLPRPPTPPLWDQHPHGDNWPQNDDLEIINDLRLDMARLQQRMNTMQKMLEACMDMQLELQRSIKQEVSAALNRSAGSSGIHDCDSPDDISKWESVRKGLCCICCESNIDSLLYRCGHLCTCSKCANELLHNRRNCPMCQAPVVEVIRTYSIL